jgi:hypothetical protein
MADKLTRSTSPHDLQLNETSNARPRVGNGNIDVGRRNFYFMSAIAIPQHKGWTSIIVQRQLFEEMLLRNSISA